MRTAALFVASFAALASCDATNPDQGRDAKLQVTGGQFFREALPSAETGPAVRSVTVSPIVRAGANDRTCSGTVDASSTSVALSLIGDPGYWIVPTGVPDVAAPDFPTFAVRVGFASSLPAGRQTLVTRAVDGAGNFGPAFTRTIDVAPQGLPAGVLVVNLRWQNEADLDLHVVDPNGVEIDKHNVNSYEPPPPGSPPEPPGTEHVGGVLDFDSNAQCVQDGLRAENVVWAEAPPRGHYVVRVDTSSLCGAVTSSWRVEAFLEGRSLGAIQGLATDADTRFSHDRGAGVLALEFDVP
ncbi:hypothetical protein AKJ09_08237 [Labilithrix luteola]|uniref:Lipoprotein n=1 Tax=Labilithrix luteola TaxID=1391654 RepID=A0A0K1Q772_9BACT|nr:hypothetical protein [Labilithrix luteola]AKV01574.1 hypothetical protein AKJ09_08237 [Labilithrix luteola]